MLDFCHVIDKTNKEIAVMDLVRRVECNLRAVMSLSMLSLKSNGSVYYKLPVGLLLRCCFSDCLMGLHLSQVSECEVRNILEDLHKEYVNSIFERYEVYRDKVSTPCDDALLQQIYTGQLEDNFLDWLEINDKFNIKDGQPIFRMWKAQDVKPYKTSKAKKALMQNLSMNPLIQRLYSYFKYFSQYEHFSESGHGDTLVDFGDDNVSFPQALDAINEATAIMVTVYDK